MKIIQNTNCLLCNRGIENNNILFPEFTDFFDINTVEVITSNPTIHWNCFEKWPKLKEYAKYSFNKLVNEFSVDEMYGICEINSEIALFSSVVNRSIVMILKSSGRRLNFSADEWFKIKIDFQYIFNEPEGFFFVNNTIFPFEWQHSEIYITNFASKFNSFDKIENETDWSNTQHNLYHFEPPKSLTKTLHGMLRTRELYVILVLIYCFSLSVFSVANKFFYTPFGLKNFIHAFAKGKLNQKIQVFRHSRGQVFNNHFKF